MRQRLIAKAKDLLESGEVSRVIGWKRARVRSGNIEKDGVRPRRRHAHLQGVAQTPCAPVGGGGHHVILRPQRCQQRQAKKKDSGFFFFQES